MSACSICMRQKSRCSDGAQPKLVVVEAECLSPDERTAFTLLSSRVATALLPDPARGELAAQCRTHGCALDQAVVIATSQRGLPLLLEAGIDDRVEIMETRKISKQVNWRLVKILEKAK